MPLLDSDIQEVEQVIQTFLNDNENTNECKLEYLELVFSACDIINPFGIEPQIAKLLEFIKDKIKSINSNYFQPITSASRSNFAAADFKHDNTTKINELMQDATLTTHERSAKIKELYNSTELQMAKERMKKFEENFNLSNYKQKGTLDLDIFKSLAILFNSPLQVANFANRFFAANQSLDAVMSNKVLDKSVCTITRGLEKPWLTTLKNLEGTYGKKALIAVISNGVRQIFTYKNGLFILLQ